MARPIRGRAIIININRFNDGGVRHGSEEDLNQLQELFGEFLHFQTKVYVDLSAEVSIRSNGLKTNLAFAVFRIYIYHFLSPAARSIIFKPYKYLCHIILQTRLGFGDFVWACLAVCHTLVSAQLLL